MILYIYVIAPEEKAAAKKPAKKTVKKTVKVESESSADDDAEESSEEEPATNRAIGIYNYYVNLK